MEKLYENNYFVLYNIDDTITIRVNNLGYDINQFQQEVLQQLPRLKVKKVSALQNALAQTIKGDVEIGNLGPICTITISNDALTAYGELALTPEEFEEASFETIQKCISNGLKQKNISYGIVELKKEDLSLSNKFTVAKGRAPISGKDAVITPYEIEKVHPKIEGTGTVDHYELSIINRVLKDDWLGERQEPTDGIDGITVLNTTVIADKGLQIQLKYDAKTVREVYVSEQDCTQLRAKCNGAVAFENDAVSVQNTIEVEGNIGYSTGNIDFNGFVEIKGSVEDNFSVIADENIEIQGEMGIGAVDLIESRHGDVYIRSGIAGRHKAIIRAKGNVYTKFASDCTIIAQGTVNIGFYAMNCHIIAKDLVFEAPNSRLMGGETQIEIKLTVSELGSKAALKTVVEVKGFDREKLLAEYKSIDDAIGMLTEKGNQGQEKFGEKLKKLKIAKQTYSNYLKVKGEGEVAVSKKVYPNVFISIKDKSLHITEEKQHGLSCHYDVGEMVVLD